MPRVNVVKKARKAIPSAGVEVGDTYYWWKFRHGGKHVSKTYPRQSQLTQSNFLSSMYAAQEGLEDAVKTFRDGGTFEELAAAIDDAINDVDSQKDECDSNRSNMPDHLQDTGTGELLQNRVDTCENIVSELDNAKSEVESGDDTLRDTIEVLETEIEKLEEEKEEYEEDDPEYDKLQEQITDKSNERDEKQSELDDQIDAAANAVEGVDWSFE